MATAGDTGIDCAMSTEGIEAALQETGLKGLNSEALAQFETYLELLLKWNARMNLTAAREPGEIVRRHFLESIQCARALPEDCERTLLDFGSGAGFPGIPIAICRPEIRITLAESQRKKAAFLWEAVRALALNAEVFDGRVEDMADDRRFGVVTLRAVDKMEEACGIASERMAAGGWIVVFATERTEMRLKAALPGIQWRSKLVAASLRQGRIWVGRREE
ncbi:MAG: 16S rRNA (guanine(527)-N(7))-methyltransferase RsmG [Acidobacteriaceae bacterium]